MLPNGMMQSLGLCIDILDALAGGSVVTRACSPTFNNRLVSLSRAGQITGPFATYTERCIGAHNGRATDGTV